PRGGGPREYETARDRAKARAAELDATFAEVELPATKGGLIPFLNDRERAVAALPPVEVITESMPCQPFASPPPAILAPPPPRDLTVDAIEEAIGDAKGAPFGRYLAAAIGRLGEL